MQRSRSNLFDHRAVLLVETHLQGLLTIRVERKQVKVIIRSPMQHSPVEIDRGIDERGGGAAIFRLDVIRYVARCHVGIVTEKHFRVCSDLTGIAYTPQGTFRRI